VSADNICICNELLVFIIKCELVYKHLEDLLQNRSLEMSIWTSSVMEHHLSQKQAALKMPIHQARIIF